MNTHTFSSHIVGTGPPVWGHMKPLAALAAKVVKERPDILITLLVMGRFVRPVEKEISRYLPERSGECLRCNIRVINTGEGTTQDPLELFSIVAKNFGPIYAKLASMETVICPTGASYDTPLRPSLVIVDFVFPEIIADIRKASENGPRVTILALNTGNASFVLRVGGPEKYGGFGDVETKARELAAATGRAVADIETELFYPTAATVLRIPGTPPIFHYELNPQESRAKEIQKAIYKKAYRFMSLCDGMIAATCAVFEPEAHEAWKRWFGETNRVYYTLGPLQPPGSQSCALVNDKKERSELTNLQNGQELLEFLDNTLQTSGSNSLIYVSWGTSFWPKVEYIWKLIDVLLELKFPFILTHASPWGIIPAEVSAKVETSGIGFLSPWVPQELILAHPVTGWFLTHCGQNSVTEAITQGIPMITWPMAADQPINAIRLSLTLNIAFELVEVRTGLGLKPLYRGITPKGSIDAVESEFRDVLKNARGPVGDSKRRNVHLLRDAMIGAWDDKGDATKALRELLDDNFP